jgi:hypothetical protein
MDLILAIWPEGQQKARRAGWRNNTGGPAPGHLHPRWDVTGIIEPPQRAPAVNVGRPW